MEKCALMLDVIIGELKLVESPVLAHRSKNPLCPIIGIKITNGPQLYIPFVTPESIKNHLHYINSGHQFLPLEVEESYLNDGNFIFHKGKSCLYTVPLDNVAKTESKNGQKTISPHLLSEFQNVSVYVLNGLHFPPTLFGKCNVEISIHNEAEGNIHGKVQLRNDNGTLVAFLTIAFTLKILGEDVALHTKSYNQETKFDSQDLNLHKLISNQNIKAEKILKPYDASNNSVDALGQQCFMNKDNIYHNMRDTHIEHSFISVRPAEETSSNSQHCKKSSEEIATKLAILVQKDKEYKEIFVHPIKYDNQGECKYLSQPAPIMYSGPDLENERLWNKKMQEIGAAMNDIETFDLNRNEDGDLNFVTYAEARSTDNNIPDIVDDDSPTKTIDTKDDTFSKTDGLVSVEKRLIINKSKIYHPMRTPKGWLRSTPIASCGIYKREVYPRLTRSTLLHRAQRDPHIEHQLKAEVDLRVKQKLQLLDKKFAEELLFAKKKTQMRNKSHNKISVSCQVDNKQDMVPFQNILNSKSDFSQQTALVNTANQLTQAQMPIKKESKLSKYYICDIDMSGGTKNHAEKYDADFEELSLSLSENLIHENSNAYDTQISYSVESHMTSKSENESQKSSKNLTNHSQDQVIQDLKSVKISNSDQSLAISQHKHDSTVNSLICTDPYQDQSSSIYKAKSISDRNNSSGQNDNVFSSEPEEISEDSSLSKEVYQELMKGKQADYLLRNGSQIQDRISSNSSLPDDAHFCNGSSRYIPVDSIKEKSTAHSANLISRKFGETFSIGEIPVSVGEYSQAKSCDEITSESQSAKGRDVTSIPAKTSATHLSMAALQSPSESPRRRIKLQEHRKHPLNTTYIISPQDRKVDSESSISNISARIAALLMPKTFHIASLRTDSVSSYMPSNVSDTLC
ncbi:hypothetical protein SK128_019504 [Halocaridina rubra]|uniref:Uncharacterized protein n=1 Tax=Halocaridina rubra TaxID=373956 RepID=A0AAN8XC04_HALRR